MTPQRHPLTPQREKLPRRRVVVTSPQTRIAHAHRRHRGGRRQASTLDPAEVERAVGLYRAQRTRALSAIVLLFALVLGLPLLLAALPELSRVRVLDVPVSWLAVVVIPFPAMALLALWQLRRAERVERAAQNEAERSGQPGRTGKAP
jgi:hypothetical protein